MDTDLLRSKFDTSAYIKREEVEWLFATIEDLNNQLEAQIEYGCKREALLGKKTGELIKAKAALIKATKGKQE